MTKRILIGTLLLAAALVVQAEERASCNGVTTAGACAEVIVSSYEDVYVTVQCATASTSEIVLESKYCASCDWVRYPKVGDPPITNIGSVPNKPSRTFKFPPKTYSIRGNVLSVAAGTLYVWVNFE